MDSPETKIYSAVIIASITIGIIILYFVISLIRHQRRFSRVARRNVLFELAMLEKDRMRIAADLHDELCPVLSAIKYQIDSVDTADNTDQEALDTSKTQVDYLAGRLRDIARDLMPVPLITKGLGPALEDFFSLIRRGGGPAIIFKPTDLSVLPEEKSLNCYRIIQEITHNTVKHANASTLLVQFTRRKDHIEVICEDNGAGFHYENSLSEAAGLGLRNIRSRADIISTNFQVRSIPGKGTQYRFDIPLNTPG